MDRANTRIQAGLSFLVANTISLLFFNVVRSKLIQSDFVGKHLAMVI